MPGLVDAHCHVGLEMHGAVPNERAEEHALADRAAGALLLRDAGSPADTRWMDERDDLPRIIRAGRHIARPKRYLRNYAAEVEPDELVAEVERQAARGDGWVKLVGDWIDRDVGDLTPLWPAEVAAAAIARAHELGCRVTAHVFGEQAVAELVAAGIDGIEHGTGHRRRHHRADGRAPGGAGPDAWSSWRTSSPSPPPARPSSRRTRRTCGRCTPAGSSGSPRAYEAGVPIYAGTDAGGYLPHGLVGREMAMLAEFTLARVRARRRVLAGAGLAGPTGRAGRRGPGRPGGLRRRPAAGPQRADAAERGDPARRTRRLTSLRVVLTGCHPDRKERGSR